MAVGRSAIPISLMEAESGIHLDSWLTAPDRCSREYDDQFQSPNSLKISVWQGESRVNWRNCRNNGGAQTQIQEQ